MKTPGPDHPITIAPSGGRLRVTIGGVVVADTRDALTLREASYPPVHYIPRADARMELFAKTARTTGCPYKGEASYYTAEAGGDVRADCCWSYEAPYPAVGAIAGHLAFYPDRVDAISTEP